MRVKLLAVPALALAALAGFAALRRSPEPPPRVPAPPPPPVPAAATRPSMEAFETETMSRRQEQVRAIAAESDAARRRELEIELADFDRRKEIEGLEIKRAAAMERGDRRAAAEIERLIAQKRGR